MKILASIIKRFRGCRCGGEIHYKGFNSKTRETDWSLTCSQPTETCRDCPRLPGLWEQLEYLKRTATEEKPKALLYVEEAIKLLLAAKLEISNPPNPELQAYLTKAQMAANAAAFALGLHEFPASPAEDPQTGPEAPKSCSPTHQPSSEGDDNSD